MKIYFTFKINKVKLVKLEFKIYRLFNSPSALFLYNHYEYHLLYYAVNFKKYILLSYVSGNCPFGILEFRILKFRRLGFRILLEFGFMKLDFNEIGIRETGFRKLDDSVRKIGIQVINFKKRYIRENDVQEMIRQGFLIDGIH
jgi:hypothetical protein